MSSYIDVEKFYAEVVRREQGAYQHLMILDPENGKNEWIKWNAIFNERIAFKHDIMDFEKADVEEVIHSHWIKEEASSALFDTNDTFYICEHCGKEQHYPYPNCPWCRAKMDADRTVEVDSAISEIKMLEELLNEE